MDRLTELRAAAGGSGDSTLDTTSPPSEAYNTANESSMFYSISDVDISSIKDDSYKIGKQIEAANILSGGVDIFEDNSYDGDELVIDDNADDDKSNSEKQGVSLQENMEPTLIGEEADIGSKDTEVVLQIDGKNVDAIDIGNGLYLYRKEGEEELAAVQIIDDDQHQPNFKFLKVRENAEGNLEVYEEIEIEVPKEVPPKEGKAVRKNTPSHVPIKDINKVMSESANNKVPEKQSPNKELPSASIDAEAHLNKDQATENKSDGNFSGKMKKINESRKSPVVGSFTPMTYHSTPNKEGKPLTKTMVDLQLHPSRHSDNVKKTIEVHTDNCKQKANETVTKKDLEDSKASEINIEKENVLDEEGNNTPNKEVKDKEQDKADNNVCSSSEENIGKDIVTDVSLVTNSCEGEKKNPIVPVETEIKDPTLLEDNNKKISEGTSIIPTVQDTNQSTSDNKIKAPQLTSIEKTNDDSGKAIETTQVSTKIESSIPHAETVKVMDEINENVECTNITKVLEAAKTIKETQENISSHKGTSSLNEIKEIPKDITGDVSIQKAESKQEVDGKLSECATTVVKNVLPDEEKQLAVHQSPGKLSNEKIDETKDTTKSSMGNNEPTKVENSPSESIVPDITTSIQSKKATVKLEVDNTKCQLIKTPSSLIPCSETKTCDDNNARKNTIRNTITANKELDKVATITDKEIKQNPKEIKILQDTKFIPPVHDINSKKTIVAPLLPLKHVAEIRNINIESNKVPKIDNTRGASSSCTGLKQEITTFPGKTSSDQGIKQKIEPIDIKNVSKINIEMKPINNNHTAVPFGQWTEANRQEFLNKFKSKVPTTSSNGNQIKNSNDLNRRDVLKKIDSQRQSSNALSKVNEANKVNMKNEKAFGKTNIVTQESQIPVKSERPELKVKSVPEKTVPKSEIKQDLTNKAQLSVPEKTVPKSEMKQSSTNKAQHSEPEKTVTKIEMKQSSTNKAQHSVPEKTVPKSEVRQGSTNKLQHSVLEKTVVKPEVKQGSINNVQLATNESAPKKESKQRTEVNYQDLIDKTIEDIIHRGAPVKVVRDESKPISEKDASTHKNTGSYPQNYPPIDEIATLDAIEMKMNELHGIPFIERPAHELPKVLKSDIKNVPKSDKEKPSPVNTNKISDVLPVANENEGIVVKDNPVDMDSEEEIIEHVPVTGDLDLSKKDPVLPPSSEKLPLIIKTDTTSAEVSTKDPIITEKDFDKFVRRNSVTCENRITVNFEDKETNNVVQTVVQKDTASKHIAKSNWGMDNKSKLQLIQNIRKHEHQSIIPRKLHEPDKFGTASNETNRNQSKVQKAYQSALTVKRQKEYPITIIEDKPVKVVFMDTMDFTPTKLNAQGKDLSPIRILTTESEAVATYDSLDSDVLDNTNDNKPQEDTKVKTKHQRKQVLTPVQEPELELIEPRDLGIESPNKKKRKAEEDKSDKNLKYPMRKKYYLLGSSTLDEKQHNIQEVTKSPLTENRNENMHSHQSHVSAIDNLVKAAELIETQSENAKTNQDSDSQQSTPVKRGRGRPRKYPLPEGVTDKSKVPSPQKKPRLIDAKPAVRDAVTDDEDSEGGIIKENWTMGKINENIVCPICNKLFRTENVVFKHVKHCTGPSPNRSDSDKRSPRRSRYSQESDGSRSHDSQSDDMDADDDQPLRSKADRDTSIKCKSKDSAAKPDAEKKDVIVIEDTSVKERTKVIDDKKLHDPKKQKSKIPHKSNDLVCEFCGKTFRQLSYLVNHKHQHKKDESNKTQKEAPIANKSAHSCEVCKKEFRKLHHLVQHRIIHNPNSMPVRSSRKSSSEQSEGKNEKNSSSSKQSEDTSAGFRCEPCDKSFRKLHHLVEHRETHDGINRQKNIVQTQNNVEKPVLVHACDVCKKTFRKLHHLIEHKEQHMDTGSEKSDDKSVKSALSTRDIIHECSLCYMVFPNEHSLTKHTVICQRKKRQSKQKQDEGTETIEETSDNRKSEEKVTGDINTPNRSHANDVNDILKNELEENKKVKDCHSNERENAEKNVEIQKLPVKQNEDLKINKSDLLETDNKEESRIPNNDTESQENKEIVNVLEKATEHAPEKIKSAPSALEKMKSDMSEIDTKVPQVSEKTQIAPEKRHSVELNKTKSISENLISKSDKIKKKSEVPKIKKPLNIPEKMQNVPQVPEKRRKVSEELDNIKNTTAITEENKKVTKKEIIKIKTTFKKKTPIKEKAIAAVAKNPKTISESISAVEDLKPPVESSDDNEVRYMLNPDFIAAESKKKFMKVGSEKRSSLQIERPTSNDLVKRRISLQHPPKISRLKLKLNDNNSTVKQAAKTIRLETVPSTDSDDSDVVKYSFPKTVAEKTGRPVQNTPKDAERKTQTKVEKRKTLTTIAKRKSIGKVVSKNKPSPAKPIKRRTLGVEHRCDCGQLFSSAALLARHAVLAHTPPRVRRRRGPPDPPPPAHKAPSRKSSLETKPKPAASRKSSLRSDASKSIDGDRPPQDKTAKSSAKPKRTAMHRGVPVPEKMRKLMLKNK